VAGVTGAGRQRGGKCGGQSWLMVRTCVAKVVEVSVVWVALEGRRRV
jgi:hypothetical protein